MSESHQAQLLAQWLESGPGTAPPNDLDPEVVEGIYALRPDLAPVLRVTVDEVLSAVTDGPFIDPEIAQTLRTWLEGPPGAPPPEALSKDVVEAAYALHPDRAPAHRVTIDDILDTVEAGPLKDDTVVDLATKRLDRSSWVWPSIGVIAVAATALLFVNPIAHKAELEPAVTLKRKESAVREMAPEESKKAKRASIRPQTGAAIGADAAEKPMETMEPPAVFEDASDHPAPIATASAPARELTPADDADVATEPPQPSPPPPPSALPEASPPPTRAATSRKRTTRAERQARGQADYGSGGTVASTPSAFSANLASPPATEPTMDDIAEMSDTRHRTVPVEIDFEGVVEHEGDAMLGGAALETAVETDAERGIPTGPARLDARSVQLQTAARQARTKLEDGIPSEALRIVDAALVLEGGLAPLRAQLYRIKADAHAMLGETDKATEARESAAMLDPAR